MSGAADGWDDVWAEYDRRADAASGATALGAAPSDSPRPATLAPRRRARHACLVLAGGALLLAGAWLFLAAEAALAASSDLAAGRVREGLLRQDLMAPQLRALFQQAASRGEQQPAGAARYLSGLAGELAEAWDKPGTLPEVIAARRAGPEDGQILLRGPTRFDLELGEGSQALTLRLELTELLPPRWQVTGIGFAPVDDPSAP
jgi:hypothetical protein